MRTLDDTAGEESELSQEALARAADWFVDFRVGDVDATTREEFHVWLRRSPQNVQAYLEIARTYVELPAIDPSGKVDVEALIACARSAANVVPLPHAAALTAGLSGALEERHRTSDIRQGWRSLRHCAFAVAVGTIGWPQLRGDKYSTDIGEQRSITLADGSTIDLKRVRVSAST